MKKTRKQLIRQRKFYILSGMLLVCIAAVSGGTYLISHSSPASTDSITQEQSASDTSADAIQTDTGHFDRSLSEDRYQYNDHLSNYLFLGIDTRGSVDTYESQMDAGQADAIFLVSMDRVTQQINVLFIPRDSMARIEVFSPSGKSLGMTTDHINIQYAYGDGRQKSCELMKTAVSSLLQDLPIQGYCSMNMDGISAVTDFIGGVEFTIPDDSMSEVNPSFTEGAVVTLSGEDAEAFVRYRDTSQTQSALVRQERQKAFLTAMLEKIRQKAIEDTGFITDLYKQMQNFTVTNMGTDLFVKLLDASQSGTIHLETLPGEGVQGNAFDEYHINEDALSELLLSLFYEKY